MENENMNFDENKASNNETNNNENLSEREKKLKDVFGLGGATVKKDLNKSTFFKSVNIPSFLRDYLIGKFTEEDGSYNLEKMSEFIKRYIPNKDEFLQVKDKIIREGEPLEILAKTGVDIDIKTGKNHFNLPQYAVDMKDTIIYDNVFNKYKDEFLSGKSQWAWITMGYQYPCDKPKVPGALKLEKYEKFDPYKVSLEDYKEMRKEFTIHEWIDVILSAIDYNPDGYEDDIQKLTTIYRLIPFVENRVNLIELAPKGTGKSTMFGALSKFGYLNTGGSLSRSTMFYDRTRRRPGFVVNYDFVALDEITNTTFTNVLEMRQALQGYLEQGQISIDGVTIKGDAGVILLGNIDIDVMNKKVNMFTHLPETFQNSALLDRFHGFIQGWNIPRLNNNLIVKGIALNSEYFTLILHELRKDGTYRQIVDEIVKIPENADTRHTEAIKRITTALLKLLFPNVKKLDDIDDKAKEIINKYCLQPAVEMRTIIWEQMCLMDHEYKTKVVGEYKIN